MRALSTSELLAVWERGLAEGPVEWALTLLAAACPDTPVDELATLSIGRRDAYLLTLREWTFGPQLASVATCPACGGCLDLSFSVADIRVTPEAESLEALELSFADHEVRFRLPNSLDLAAVASHERARADVAAARHPLLERCLLAAHCHGEDRSARQLPPEIVDAIAERMSQVDSQADVQLALSCPACGHGWQVAFDIVLFFRNEINAWASRILREVHTLASAYGWREADILALSPWRRQYYLEMVGR